MTLTASSSAPQFSQSISVFLSSLSLSLSTKDPRDEELSYFTSFVSRTLTLFSFEFFSTPSNTPPNHPSPNITNQQQQDILVLQQQPMESKSKIQLFFLTLFLFTLTLHAETLGTYIVQLHPHGITSTSFTSRLKWHLSFIQQTISSDEDPSSRLLYSYRSAMDGFAAQLTETELEYLKNLPDVISIRPDSKLQIQTTYSYKFLGLNPARENGWYQSGFGRGTIIGVLDTGVWPESPSFNDQGMPPIPQKWKGICQAGKAFNSTNCNRKLIGARYFTKGHFSVSPFRDPEYLSPRDSSGHGTHTASTAGGCLFRWRACSVMRPAWREEWLLVPTLRCTKCVGSMAAITQTSWLQWMWQSGMVWTFCPCLLVATLCLYMMIALPLEAIEQWSMGFQLYVRQETMAPWKCLLPMRLLGFPQLVQAH